MSAWQDFWQAYRRVVRATWKRDLAAWPIVTILGLMLITVLFPDASLLDYALASVLLAPITWPVGLWLVDHTLFRQHDRDREPPDAP